MNYTLDLINKKINLKTAMKTEITTSTMQKTTIDVELPYYSKQSESIFYKVCSETEALEVITGGIFQLPSIAIQPKKFAFMNDRLIATEHEFESAYAKTLLKIKQLKFKK